MRRGRDDPFGNALGDAILVHERLVDRAAVSDRSPKAMIASPFDIWCAGMESILRSSGWDAARCRPGREGDLEDELTDADLLILARRFVERPAGLEAFRPHGDGFSGKIVVVIEPGDAFSTDDFVALDVEGLILGTAGVGEMKACLACVVEGRRWVDPGIRALLGPVRRLAQPLQGLSERELEVAQLAATGLSNKRIARALRLSEGTVKMHMHHILSKLRLSSRVELVHARSDMARQAPEDFERRGGLGGDA